MPCAQFKIRVIPRAQCTGWGGKRGEALLVRLQAAPVKGSANQALLDFLSRELGLPVSALEISHGERGRDKVLRVEGLTQEELDQKLPS